MGSFCKYLIYNAYENWTKYDLYLGLLEPVIGHVTAAIVPN